MKQCHWQLDHAHVPEAGPDVVASTNGLKYSVRGGESILRMFFFQSGRLHSKAKSSQNLQRFTVLGPEMNGSNSSQVTLSQKR